MSRWSPLLLALLVAAPPGVAGAATGRVDDWPRSSAAEDGAPLRPLPEARAALDLPNPAEPVQHAFLPEQQEPPQRSASEPVGASAALQQSSAPNLGPFRGEDYRFPRRGVFRRLLADAAAIPLGVPHWSAGEWAWFATTVGVTGALFLPLDSPLDQRFQNWLSAQFPNAVPGLWSPSNDVYIFGGLFALSVGTLAYGHFTGQEPYVETFSLMLEALAIAQALHISSKLLLARDGPNNGNGRTIHGPTWETFERFPEGAPSGHTATLFALATVVSSYWENPWLTVGVYSVATAFASALVLDRYHYISDVLWGGSMGVAVGRYVVHHRSSRYRYLEGRPRRVSELQLTPLLIPATPHTSAAAGGLLEGHF